MSIYLSVHMYVVMFRTSHTHSLALTLTNTHTLPLSHSHPNCPGAARSSTPAGQPTLDIAMCSMSHTLGMAICRTRNTLGIAMCRTSHAHTLFLALKLTHTLSRTHTHTYTYTHSVTLTLTYTHTLSLTQPSALPGCRQDFCAWRSTVISCGNSSIYKFDSDRIHHTLALMPLTKIVLCSKFR